MAPCEGAPSNGTTSTHHVHSTIARYNGTLHTQQWHHVHSTIAHYNGTLQWHPAMAPRPSTTAHYNGTLQWHPAMAPRPLHPAMAFWCHVQCAKVVRRPPPLLEVRTLIAIAIWGKTCSGSTQDCPKVIGCPTFGRQGYVPEILSQQTAITSTESFEPTKSTWKKKDPFPVPGQGSPSHVYRSAIRLKHFLKSPPRSCRLRASQVMKAMLKKLQGLRSHKSSTCIIWLSTTGQAKREKQKRLRRSQKHKTFWSHHFF